MGPRQALSAMRYIPQNFLHQIAANVQRLDELIIRLYTLETFPKNYHGKRCTHPSGSSSAHTLHALGWKLGVLIHGNCRRGCGSKIGPMGVVPKGLDMKITMEKTVRKGSRWRSSAGLQDHRHHHPGSSLGGANNVDISVSTRGLQGESNQLARSNHLMWAPAIIGVLPAAGFTGSSAMTILSADGLDGVNGMVGVAVAGVN